MSTQKRYGYRTAMGAAGGIVDIAPYAIDTFLNEEDTGKLMFGMGVVQGAKAGKGIALPTGDSTAAKFEGITVNGRTTEYDVEGKLALRNGASVGVMRYGRIYARVAADANPAYGDPAHLIIEGENAGLFTKTASVSSGSKTVAIKGRFLSGIDSTGNNIAVVELFNEVNG